MRTLKSISDDDVCSDCQHCAYAPGEMSDCSLGWPGRRNPDGYVVQCVRFVPVKAWGDNIVTSADSVPC